MAKISVAMTTYNGEKLFFCIRLDIKRKGDKHQWYQ